MLLSKIVDGLRDLGIDSPRLRGAAAALEIPQYTLHIGLVTEIFRNMGVPLLVLIGVSHDKARPLRTQGRCIKGQAQANYVYVSGTHR